MPIFHLKRRIQTIKSAFELHGLKWTIKRFTNYITDMVYVKETHILSEKNLNKEWKFKVENKLKLVDIKPYEQLIRDFCEGYDYNRERLTLLTGHFFKNNYNGFVAFCEEEFVGYIWWIDKNNCKDGHMLPELTRHKLTLKDDDAYLFNFYVVPNYRGGGTAVEFLHKVHTTLHEMGYNRIMGSVVATNTPAKWIYKIIGAVDIHSIKFYRFFNKILIINGRIFVKRGQNHPEYPTDFTPLFPSKEKNTAN